MRKKLFILTAISFILSTVFKILFIVKESFIQKTKDKRFYFIKFILIYLVSLSIHNV